jgi:hypothetical protein
MYRARIIAENLSGDDIASAPSAYVAVYQPVPTRTLCKDPFAPENAVQVDMTVSSGDSTSLVEDVTEHHPLGRDGDPVFLRAWTGRERQFELTATSHQDYYRLLELLGTPSRSLLLQWPEGGQTYIRVRNWQETRIRRGQYRVSVSGSQTLRPA